MTRSFPKVHLNPQQLVFILGHPLGHTLSPAMQNEAFRAAKLPFLYLPLDIEPNQIKTVLGTMRISSIRGANVTVPYKESVIPYLDWVEPQAKWLGSVNTLYRKGRKLCGTSTDGEGFLRSLGSFRKKLKGSRGLLLGAGGAAKAVSAALAQSGVKSLFVANRTTRRADQLIRSLRGRFRHCDIKRISWNERTEFLSSCDWVVQATSMGLKKGDASPLSLKTVRPSTWVVELIYHRETAFLKEARMKRLSRLGGMGMLLHQGALSFEKWTGKKAPLKVMQKVLLHSLS